MAVKNFAEEGQTTKLFAVRNLNQVSLLILAIDARTAGQIACGFRHVRDENNASVRLASLAAISKRDPKFASALMRALTSRIQGPVRNKNGFAIVDGFAGEVFAPMSVVV